MLAGDNILQHANFWRISAAFFHVLTMLCCTFAPHSATAAERTEYPVEMFARLPAFSGAKLSSSGEKVAYFIEFEGQRHLIFQKLDGANRGMIPPIEKTQIVSFSWANDDVLIIKFGFLTNRWAFRGQSYETRTVSFNTETRENEWLGEPKRQERVSQHDRVVDLLPEDPDHILMQFDFQLDGSPTVYKVNVWNGHRATYHRGRKGIQRWYTDQNGDVRLGFGYNRSERVARLKDASGDWIDLTDTDWEKYYDVEGFTDEPNTIYVSGPTAHGTDGLFKLNLLSGQISDPLFTHESVDLDYIVEHPLTGELAGIAYTDDYSRIKYFDRDLKIVQASLEHVMPGKVVTVTGRARERELYLVLVASDRNPGDYFVYDRESKHMSYVASRMVPLASEISANPEAMAKVLPVSIPVRDGSEIPGYLTMPNGDQATGLPTVVLPHGGPQARDSAEWDYWSQFYANRGYVVLQPNFRGSSGYGKLFEYKGNKQWGGLMQDDVTDATKWLIDEGIADPDRICIVGASYGGYAALMGTIKEPGLYRCAISINGVTDLPRLKSNDKAYIGGRVWIKNMGLEGVDDEEVSPRDRVDEISAPVLLISSKDDERIPYKHSKDLYKRLKKKQPKSRYVMIEDGGHSMMTSEARLTMLTETEKFLKRHIGDQ